MYSEPYSCAGLYLASCTAPLGVIPYAVHVDTVGEWACVLIGLEKSVAKRLRDVVELDELFDTR